MAYLICGARTRSGMPCNRRSVIGGKRCYVHGGLSTGPRTPMGKLANGLRLLAVKANGAPIGHKKTSKARLRREARARRLANQSRRDSLRRKRELRWANRKRALSGLPLIQDAELEAQFMCDSPKDDETS